MKALIIDDELKAREILLLLIKHHIPQIKSCQLAAGASEASEILKNYRPDLVFLDIKMPVIDGFEWLQSLQKRDFAVIFTTAFDQYAIKAIRYAAFDYLLKPIDIEELKVAVARLLLSNEPVDGNFDALFYNISQTNQSQLKLNIRTNDGTHYLFIKNLIRCEADGNYTTFFMTDQKSVIASHSLSTYAELLEDNGFVRCHKSHLVNMLYITGLSDMQLRLKNNEQVDVSRRRKKYVQQLLNRHNILHKD